MKRTFSLAAFAVAIAMPLPAVAATINAVMYKNPQCSCGEIYVAYLKQNSFDVELKPTNDLAQISAKAGVPADLEGCHTMFIDGYAFDGLVPVDVVKKVLAERPAIAGVTLAGMPTGAPGMPGKQAAPFKIYAFTTDGKAPTLYATE